MATRWGICGAGLICADFCGAMKTLSTDEHVIQAVAASDISRAENFATRFNISNAYGSYEELAEDPDVDIIYIGTINTKHFEQCMLFLNAGKHVLCEKPMTLTLAGCEKIINVAQERQLFFMEGIWSRFFPVYDQIRKELEGGTLGDIKLLQATICLSQYEVERIRNIDLGGGGLKDIGVYAIQAAVMAFREQPIKIHVEGHVTSEGVDAGGCITLVYSGGRMASLVYHTQVQSEHNSMTILGTQGSVHVKSPFWCPTQVQTQTGECEFPLPESDHIFNFEQTAGFNYQQNAVRDCLKKGVTECPMVSHEDSKMIAYICDDILKQFNISYNSP